MGSSSQTPSDRPWPHIMALSVTLILLTTLFAVLRAWSRRMGKIGLWWDDFNLYLALITYWISAVISIVAARGGSAQEQDTTGLAYTAHTWADYFFVIEIFYLVAIWLTKFALALMMVRVFGYTYMRRVMYAVTALVVLAFVGTIVASCVLCVPFSHYHPDQKQPGFCFDQHKSYAFLAFPSLLIGIILTTLSLAAFWRLTMPTRRKIQLTSLFAFTSLGFIPSIMRITSFVAAKRPVSSEYESSILLAWTVVEPATHLILSCMLSIIPLTRRLSREAKKAIREWTQRKDQLFANEILLRRRGADESCDTGAILAVM